MISESTYFMILPKQMCSLGRSFHQSYTSKTLAHPLSKSNSLPFIKTTHWDQIHANLRIRPSMPSPTENWLGLTNGWFTIIIIKWSLNNHLINGLISKQNQVGITFWNFRRLPSSSSRFSGIVLGTLLDLRILCPSTHLEVAFVPFFLKNGNIQNPYPMTDPWEVWYIYLHVLLSWLFYGKL